MVISAMPMPALVNMSPPADHVWRVSVIQGEKRKRAEGSVEQDRGFYQEKSDIWQGFSDE